MSNNSGIDREDDVAIEKAAANLPVTSQDDVLEVTKERPYGELNFIGTYVAVCLGSLACYGGFVMPATSLALINEDIGASANVVWVILAWTLCLAVGYTLVGRLSDIFGRRWFFIGASVLATVGCIIGATAKSIYPLIGGNALIGLATSAQLSFNYIITELVPIRDRFYVLALIFLFAIPFSSFGPVIARLFIVHTTAGWRWCYYVNIIFKLYMPLNRPLVPMHLFRDRDFTVLTIISAVGGMLYYSLNGKPSQARSNTAATIA
ncbi:hypothetical protein LTR37_008495 [Vermiconidia calcicola]|uniref:Uncharacterized protein n=1 Tax=Vermiconidia calcicola TaxID=1690605 RepID=A0ACC3NDL1_9PEZI|nr:hypothetical protein LTR37_008495 [Vermiconidia calcicola]